MRPENCQVNLFLGGLEPGHCFDDSVVKQTDSLSFFFGQLGCFIYLKINSGTKSKRCERVRVTPAAGIIDNLPNKIIMCTALESQKAVSTHL